MSFANDKLYNSYLRNNMSSIVSKVKVREIIVHLACLTAHDRETIEAKRDTCGNYDGMVLLLDCLKRRESWPEHFIQALELCEHTSIAAEVRAEYDALRDSNPSSPPPAVVKAHVHSAPSSPHISAPEPGRHSQDAAAPPSPPQSTPNATPPPVVRAQTEASTMSPPPEPPRATETPPVVPPFSPDRARPQESAEPERPDHNLQQPEEYSESDFQGILCADPDGVSAGEVSVGCVAPPQPAETAEQCDTDSPPGRPFASDVPSEPSHTTLTPERLPVQDTTPPMDKVAAVDPEPEENLKPPATQIVTCCTQTGSTSASSTQPTGEDGTMCLSVPRPLVSIQPQDSNDTAPTSPPMPYSGNSDRLEISDSAQNTETAEPEENHLEEEEDEEVQVNVVHVTQQPSVLNLDGQCIGNGEASKDVASSAKEQVSTPSGEKCINADVTPADIAAKKPAPRRLSTNAKYIMTAAGVGACALLMAWKLKH
ncbi:mitochondrial antiviral-signaling protein isoform X2 [Dunckerocampus dactyliophorus]|uniref:mitochondrial antiviral-signaling protein isoform X2 n=1 Tax=Dunckerocampus dactyliophorus TaxID=161453 RepID=UPI0024049B85|nr:mitochondrial antiviral-signaling protein isoform X2 [Dunckerocampus dactyliophorus]